MAFTVIVRGGRPRLVKQLQTGSPTAPVDCGPATVTTGIRWASRHELAIGLTRARRWIQRLREQMTHLTFWPATSLYNHEEGVESRPTARRFRASGYRSPNLTLQVSTHDNLIEELKQGHFIDLGIDYSIVNHLMPKLSGSPGYMGGHFVGLLGYGKNSRGVEWTWLYDPLFDGRRDGIPLGAQMVRVRRYLRAAETFGTPDAGPGRAKYAVLKRPRRLLP